MKSYNSIIDVLFRKEMAVSKSKLGSRSESPSKPIRLMEHIQNRDSKHNFNIIGNFKPYTANDFNLAHDKYYVYNFFRGRKSAINEININWSKEFAISLKYTNASLYHSILNSINNPKTITLSPVSGLHHATPYIGKNFCSFSGQVIASSKIYEELGLSGAYIDLDAHYGNSIEDSRKYVKNLNDAIPKGFNINPTGEGKTYIKSLKNHLEKLKQALLGDKIHYVVFCHGSDSHIDDDLGCGSLSTEEWLICSKLVYNMIEETSLIMGKNVPLVLTLFGGYRADNYEFVLDLHLKSILNSIK